MRLQDNKIHTEILIPKTTSYGSRRVSKESEERADNETKLVSYKFIRNQRRSEKLATKTGNENIFVDRPHGISNGNDEVGSNWQQTLLPRSRKLSRPVF